MGVRGRVSPLERRLEAAAGGGAWLATSLLEEIAHAWAAGPASRRDAQANRQFLAVFAIQLVHQFRVEEDLMKRTRSAKLAQCRRKNHQLARQLQQLMFDLDLGLDLTGRIQGFLVAWRAPQGGVFRRPLAKDATEQ